MPREVLPVIITVALGFSISALIFLLCRAIVLWYFKVDKIVALLERIAEQLENPER